MNWLGKTSHPWNLSSVSVFSQSASKIKYDFYFYRIHLINELVSLSTPCQKPLLGASELKRQCVQNWKMENYLNIFLITILKIMKLLILTVY